MREATRELVREMPSSRVLILTTFDLDEYVYDAMKAEASGFVLRDVFVGWAMIACLVVADWEGGHAVAVAARVAYVISEIGVVMIFGTGAMLLGTALIVLAVGSPAAPPSGVRWCTLAAGVCRVAGVAFFTFFLLPAWAVAVGMRLVAAARRAGALQPGH